MASISQIQYCRLKIGSITKRRVMKFDCSSSCFQALKSATLGKVTNFQAIPGCGLICQVTNVYNLVDGSSSQVDLMNMRNAVDEYTVTIDGVTLSESSNSTSSIGRLITSSNANNTKTFHTTERCFVLSPPSITLTLKDNRVHCNGKVCLFHFL